MHLLREAFPDQPIIKTCLFAYFMSPAWTPQDADSAVNLTALVWCRMDTPNFKSKLELLIFLLKCVSAIIFLIPVHGKCILPLLRPKTRHPLFPSHSTSNQQCCWFYLQNYPRILDQKGLIRYNNQMQRMNTDWNVNRKIHTLQI